ncbi:alpha/beta hydrolase [Actinoplanes sp. N902-109]|uniref:alpha/beta hydrolase n=1 Tax=Actinoplanes sp. (strain N902-109) TaxID=649831 RepID=UPI0003294978|nr:alpha/beta hydrolase [Actinoplanes sp. N902-109]AGL14496.1 hypothetical protein L083_0986 [Actinoplanes sp. N902-109]
MTLLDATDPAQWRAAALFWRALATTAGQWIADIKACAARAGRFWQGSCAGAAMAAIGRLVRGLTAFRLGCWAADQALSEFAAALTRARAGAGLPAARAADTTTTGLLNELFLPPVPPPGGGQPSCTSAPGEVRRWWESLSPGRRDWVLATQPGWLGSLDGIPAAARDRANRLLLAGPFAERLIEDRGGQRAYLLRLDPGGDGRVVVALGDPDRASAVLTQVPGMTADLTSAGNDLTRTERIAVRAHELAPAQSVSTIMWLGYDAPDHLGEAASGSRAVAGARELRRFQEGLRATHLGPPGRQTVLGHSYGSLVVGRAAAAPGLADSVIFVGSPGVGVDHVNQLAVPADEVWAMTARHDVIQWVVSPRRAVGALIAGPLAGSGDALFFGADPAGPAFGARTVASQPDAGHLGYWDKGRPALDALAAITLGRGDVIPR